MCSVREFLALWKGNNDVLKNDYISCGRANKSFSSGKYVGINFTVTFEVEHFD